ncbi:MAG: hypothetical protein FAZ92_01850 [Accumulibacter sp.]|nr:hypothetical protein [Accumulibacter sp.]MDS4055354.1 hypothetical protein [Accumulibacter sp.]TLD45859.1 MAG: hypothetical protein FAZ92_01850 [Accumulibacter sp.]
MIFNAHPLTERQGADTFTELLDIRLQGSRQTRERQQQALTKASVDLADERVKKDGLKALEKDRDEKKGSIEKDKTDRKSLVTKGNEERTSCHEQVSLAVDEKRQLVDQARRRHQALLHLQNDVSDFRTRQAPSLLADLKDEREDAGLSASDWEAFKLDYVGPVDSLLIERIKQANLLVTALLGPAETDPPTQESPDPAIALIPANADLRDAKKRRQIIIVTHNANLVVNTDADQVIVAQCGPHQPGQLPPITYECGSLENPLIRQHVCDILEGGERAFKERAKRLRVSI